MIGTINNDSNTVIIVINNNREGTRRFTVFLKYCCFRPWFMRHSNSFTLNTCMFSPAFSVHAGGKQDICVNTTVFGRKTIISMLFWFLVVSSNNNKTYDNDDDDDDDDNRSNY